MTPRQIELIENSWDFVILNTKETGQIFYTKLFELDSDLKQLFKTDINSQSQKLIALITFVVHKLNTLEEVSKDVKALGVRHKNYKVKEEHYATVAAALLWTLEKSLGNQWNDELKEAWTTVYTVLSSIMIEAQNAN
jgi:hemoglobin-like flavoprotein